MFKQTDPHRAVNLPFTLIDKLVQIGLDCVMKDTKAQTHIEMQVHSPIRTRKPMTPAQKKAVSKRMKKYWAARRKHS
jgi:hypothetical protein